MTKIKIDGEDYEIESLPEAAQINLKLLEVAQQRLNKARMDLQIEDAAVMGIAQRLKSSMADATPLKPNVVNTEPPKQAAPKRRTAKKG